MRKLLLSIISLVACFVVSNAQETSVTFNFMDKDYGFERGNSDAYLDDQATCSESPVTMTLFKQKQDATSSGNGCRLWSDGLRFYKNSSMTLAVPEGYVITSISLQGTATFRETGTTNSLSSKASWTGSSALVKFDMTATSTKAISQLTVTYQQTSGEIPDPTFKVSYIGEHGKVQTYGMIGVDEVTAEGLVYDEGTYLTFWATADEGYELKKMTDNGTDVTAAFLEGEYKINGIKENHLFEGTFTEVLPENAVMFDFVNNSYGYDRDSGSTGSSYLESGSTCVEQPVTVTLTKDEGTNGMRFYATGLRFHKKSNSAFTVSVPAGYLINKIIWTKATKAKFALADGEAGELTDDTWTGSAQSVKFNYTSSDNADMYTLRVDYAEDPNYVAPVTGSLLVPGVTFNEGESLYTFRFDDAVLGAHENGTNTEETDLRSRNFTYSAWVNLKDVKNEQVVMGNIQTDFTDATGAFLVTYKDGKLNLNGRDALTISSFDDMVGSETTDPGTPNNEWVFISVIADKEAGTVTLYKNGQAISSYNTTYGVGLLPDKSCFFIADKGASVAISEVQLWNKALSTEELKDSYNFNAENIPAALVAYYKPGEMVEGSTTDLRNLGSEATTPAQLLCGTYQPVGWTPYFKNPAAQDIDVISEVHELKSVAVSLAQPEAEGCSFKLVNAKGEDVADKATLFEKLNVVASFADGVELKSVKVSETNNNVTSEYTPEQLPFRVNDDINVSVTTSADALPKYRVKVNITNGTARVMINDGNELDVPEAGFEAEKGSKVVVFLKPLNNDYKLTAFTVNGTDYLPNMTQNVYSIENIQEDYTLDATFVVEQFHLDVINQGSESSHYYGEFRNNRNERLDYDDAKGIDVEKNTTVYFAVKCPVGTDETFLVVEDNDTDVTSEMMPMGARELIYIMGRITSDHTIKVSGNPYAAISGVGADNGELIFNNGMITAPEGATIEVFDINGRIVARSDNGQLDATSLTKGTYVVRAIANGKAASLKFVKF